MGSEEGPDLEFIEWKKRILGESVGCQSGSQTNQRQGDEDKKGHASLKCGVEYGIDEFADEDTISSGAKADEESKTVLAEKTNARVG